MYCPQCGREAETTATFCVDCGARLEASYGEELQQETYANPAAEFPQVAQQEDFVDHDLRARRERLFDVVRQSSAYRQRNDPARLARVRKPSAMVLVFLAVFAGIALSIGGCVTLGFAAMAGPLAILPLAGVVFMLGIAGFIARTTLRRMNAPPVAREALCATKRIQVSGGNDSSTHTHHWITFEFPSGQREEFSCDRGNYREIAEGDAGVLFTRADWVADFDRVTSR